MSSFLVKDAVFRGWLLLYASLPLLIVGIIMCLLWYKIIIQYKRIIGWHYEQLRKMEQDIPGSSKIYTNEWETFFQPRQGKERFGFARLEIWIPQLLFGVYCIYSVILVVSVILNRM
jgi:hypothetical protein